MEEPKKGDMANEGIDMQNQDPVSSQCLNSQICVLFGQYMSSRHGICICNVTSLLNCKCYFGGVQV